MFKSKVEPEMKIIMIIRVMMIDHRMIRKLLKPGPGPELNRDDSEALWGVTVTVAALKIRL